MVRRLDSRFWLVACIAAIIMFYNLGMIPLLDPDEPVYAETPKEMINYNEFLSPRIYGEYWYDKPPLYYWLVAAAFKIFGISEFSARFPSALLALAGVLILYLWGREVFNKRAAMAGALILATSIEYFYLGKAAVTDITLTFCLTLALLGFITKRYYMLYIFTGLATLTKGPVGFLFPGAIILLYLAVTNRWRVLLEMKLARGLPLFALVALPWYVFMVSTHGNAFIDTFLGFHNITRFTSPEHPEVVVWYYFVPVLVLGFFPWTAILVQAVWASLLKSSPEHSRPLLFMNIWAVFIFIFFSISQTKLVSYILPMYPPLALIAGWYIDQVWASREHHKIWAITFSLLAGGLIAGMYTGAKFLPPVTAGFMLLAVLIGSMTLCTIVFMWRRQTGRVFWTQVTGMVLFSLVLVSQLFPAAAPYFTAKYIAEKFTASYDGQSPVYIIKFLHPGFAYYTDFYGQEINIADLAAAVNLPGKAYFIIQQADYQLLVEAERQKLKVVDQSADKMIMLKE